jgi:methionyl-tRNA formyltransferase
VKINIGYFADGPWSHKTFDYLVKDPEVKISFICARYESKDETLKDLAKFYNIDYFKDKNVNSDKFISILKKYNCDLFISMSFNQIFKSKIINLTKYKIINCHAGKLPFYRGRNVLNWVLINDEKDFGITVHYVDEGIDTGDIILQKTFQITDSDNYKTILKKAYLECANILYEVVSMFKKGNVIAYKQKELANISSYFSKRKEGDEILNWNQTSREIFNFVRAICKPGPVARAFINLNEMKINKVELIDKVTNYDYEFKIGNVVDIANNSFIVKTKDNFINITEFEFDGNINIGDSFEI